MKRFVKIILLIICGAIFLFSAYKIYNNIKEDRSNKKLNNELVQKAVSKVDIKSDKNNNENNKDIAPVMIDFSILNRENEDIVGWIYSEDTPINYPVVQSNDNKYYLRRLIDGSYNMAGSIFMDYRNTSNLSDSNTIIYGHNMKNDMMFGTLEKYKNQDYYNNHKAIYYFTPEKKYKLELVSGFTTSVDSDIYDFSKFNINKVNEFIKKSNFKSDVLLTKNDKFITLSTCSYDYEDARYILIGVLREIT